MLEVKAFTKHVAATDSISSGSCTNFKAGARAVLMFINPTLKKEIGN
jgi:hypothetical protein